MNRSKWLIPVILLAGCSGESPSSAEVQPKKEDHLLQMQVNALEKAKGVEQMLQQAAEEQRLKIEQQTRQ